jgi:arginine deiminase
MPDSAHGGPGWIGRVATHEEEIGTIWAPARSGSECGLLRWVLLHRPSVEIETIDDPSAVLWLELLDPILARKQHDDMANEYMKLGIRVAYLDADGEAFPNLFFTRDLFTMTPQGAFLARMAARIRAGEEGIVAKSLAEMKIPIIGGPLGCGTFEGPDLVFLREDLALIGIGQRTNLEGARQVTQVLSNVGISTVQIQTTYGCGHLDGVLSIVDRDLAVVHPRRISYQAVEVLRFSGYRILDLPDDPTVDRGMAINMVAVAPGHVFLPAGNPATETLLERTGVKCTSVDVSELMKGGGAIHCMTGVLQRDPL